MKKNFTTLLVSLGMMQIAGAQTLQTGPSTTTTPYMWPSVPSATVKSILTVGDLVGGYPLAGLGDGLGAFDNGGNTFTLLMNHEMGSTSGTVHAHGQVGGFVSKWVINKSNLQVVSGGDLIQNVKLWTGTTYTTYNAASPSTLTAFARFCAADLPELTAFYNPLTGNGSQDRIFMNGEETGNEGRGFAHVASGVELGTSYQVPHLGRYSYENAVASPYPQEKTIVVGLDDATPGQVYVYIGNKSNTGNPIEKAGLFGGKLYGVGVLGMVNEQSGSFPAANTTFNLIDLGLVQNLTGSTLNTNSNNAGVTNFLRPEDGAWDPNRPTDFYFVTTNSFNSPSRLWRLRFNDIENPELGGKVEVMLTGTEGPKMMDNMVMDNHGHILIQEDPGGQNHTAKVWEYKISNDGLAQVMDHDTTRFKTGGVNFLTLDEESSGIIDMQGILGAGWFILYDQAHYALPSPLVDGGQLLAFYNPATAAANPEINLLGNNTSIPDGNISVSVGNNTDFGTTNVGTMVTKTFEIQNTTTGNLIVSSIYMSGTNAGDFMVSSPSTPFNVGPNSTQSITVMFTASLTGLRSAKVNVVSSDWDEKFYDFAVSGTGALPEINVQGNSTSIPSGNSQTSVSDNTDFGGVQLGSSLAQTFVIQNTSSGVLSVNSITMTGANSNEFTLLNPPAFPFTVAANSSQNISIQFLPITTGIRNAIVLIQNSDADESNYSFAIKGTGELNVGIPTQEAENFNLSVYPNPSNNEATIKMNLVDNTKIAVEVYDITGALVYSVKEKQIQKGEQRLVINTASLANGEYFVSVKSNNKAQTTKLVVMH